MYFLLLKERFFLWREMRLSNLFTLLHKYNRNDGYHFSCFKTKLKPDMFINTRVKDNRNLVARPKGKRATSWKNLSDSCHLATEIQYTDHFSSRTWVITSTIVSRGDYASTKRNACIASWTTMLFIETRIKIFRWDYTWYSFCTCLFRFKEMVTF